MMKIFLFLLFLIPSFAISTEPEAFKNLAISLERSSFEQLPEIENAYGRFNGKEAENTVKGENQQKPNELHQTMLNSRDNKIKDKDAYELTIAFDEIDSKINTTTQDTVKEKEGVQIFKCYESHHPEIVIANKRLDIEVLYTPEVKKQTKVIEPYYGKALTHENEYKIVDVLISPEKREIINEFWVEEDESIQALLNDPEATFIQKQCIDAYPNKTINGLLVSRPCWKESYAFLRKRKITHSPDCDTLRNKKCSLILTKCIEGSEQDCQLWELTYECFGHYKITSFNNDLNLSESLEPIEPNHSFCDVFAKLSVFQAMKEELAKSKAYDPLKVEIFKGEKRKCEKSMASNLIYDCCFSYSGLAKKVGLAKCSSEEITLASWREQGQCHFIGVKEIKTLGLVTTGYEHVFCCFPTKLARVINEQARKQLGIEWGSPEHPNCQGLTIEQIQKLDFNQINLEEVFERDLNGLEEKYQERTKDLNDPSKSETHLEAIKQKMKAKLENSNEN